MRKRVVITGIGPVTAIGIGKHEFFTNLLNHSVCVQESLPEFRGYRYKSKYVSPLPQVRLSDFGLPVQCEKIMQDEDRLAVVAAKIALEDAGFELAREKKSLRIQGLSSCGLLLGIGFSGLEKTFESYLAHLGLAPAKETSSFTDGKPGRFHKMIIPMIMPNSIAAWVSILFQVQGCGFTVNASCASGTIAIGEAYHKIRDGHETCVITGGVECLKDKEDAIKRGFDVLGVLTQDDQGLPYPFSRQRSGFLFSQGAACVLILEELEHALMRDADIYAEITAFSCNSEGYNIVQMNPNGEQVKNMLWPLVQNNKINYFNTHGTATVANDQIEAQVIQTLFGKKSSQPYINSSKGILGHSLGASGALEAAVTALSIQQSVIHPNRVPDPMEEINLVLEPIKTSVETALSASYGFGGHNAALLFKRYCHE